LGLRHSSQPWQSSQIIVIHYKVLLTYQSVDCRNTKGIPGNSTRKLTFKQCPKSYSYVLLPLLSFTHAYIGNWCKRLPRLAHSFSTFKERQPRQSVSLVANYICLVFLVLNVNRTARGQKAEALRLLYAKNPSLEVVEIADIVHGQFQNSLVGVDAVIHTASPLPGRMEPEEMLKVCSIFKKTKLFLLISYRQTAIQGSLNILRQAEKAGIRKFVVTSSMSTLIGDPSMKGVTFTDQRTIIFIFIFFVKWLDLVTYLMQ
jgi:hypothetical protein